MKISEEFFSITGNTIPWIAKNSMGKFLPLSYEKSNIS